MVTKLFIQQFFYNSKYMRFQIRSFDMNSVAEYGIAAHWAYKKWRKK